MGGVGSRALIVTNSNSIESSDVDLVKRSVDTDSELEFKKLLSNGVFMQYFVIYSKLNNNSYLLTIWEIIGEHESTNTNASRLLDSLCLVLFSRQDMFPMAGEFIRLSHDTDTSTDAMERKAVERKLLLQQIKTRCFQLMWCQIYKPFSTTPEHYTMCEYIRDPSSWITHNSFQYLNIVAQGAYGVVVQCRKIRTNQIYAMKIQLKMDLLRQYRSDKSRVTSELEASTVFNHPYIAVIAYALQTETMVMLVSRISACGDLARSRSLCPEGRMNLDRVIFYGAEISSALMYMHKHDIMYRDLKPGNVLLNADGHIMLADFGSLAGIIFIYLILLFIFYLYAYN